LAGEVEALLLREQAALVEDVDESRESGASVLHQEMAGKPDAVNWLRQAPPHLQIHDRQRDGDAGTGCQHVVQATVARIVIVRRIAFKPQLREEVLVGRFDVSGAAGAARQALGQFHCVGIQNGDKRRDVQVGMLDAGDFERRPIQGDLVATAGEQVQQWLHGKLK